VIGLLGAPRNGTRFRVLCIDGEHKLAYWSDFYRDWRWWSSRYGEDYALKATEVVLWRYLDPADPADQEEWESDWSDDPYRRHFPLKEAAEALAPMVAAVVALSALIAFHRSNRPS